MALIRKIIHSLLLLSGTLFLSPVVFAAPPPSVDTLLKAMPVLEPGAGDNEPFDIGVSVDTEDVSFGMEVFHDGRGAVGMVLLDGLDDTPVLLIRPSGEALVYGPVSGELLATTNTQASFILQNRNDEEGVRSLSFSFGLSEKVQGEGLPAESEGLVYIDLRSLLAGLDDLLLAEDDGRLFLIGRTAGGSTVTAGFVDEEGPRLKGVLINGEEARIVIKLFSHGEPPVNTIPPFPLDELRAKGYEVVEVPFVSDGLFPVGSKMAEWMITRYALHNASDEESRQIIEALGLTEAELAKKLERDEQIAADLRRLLSF